MVKLCLKVSLQNKKPYPLGTEHLQMKEIVWQVSSFNPWVRGYNEIYHLK